MIQTVAQFFLDQWIWSITWGLYQSIASVMVLTLLSWFLMRCSLISSFFIASTSQLFALILLSLFVYGGIVVLGGFTYPSTHEGLTQPLSLIEVALLLGITYTILQLLFFKLFKVTFEVPYYITIILVLLSNMVSALWAYWSLPSV
jgi:hypothetical protein